MSSIKLEVFNQNSLPEQIAVGKTVYSSPEVMNIDHIRWKHIDGPYGESTAINLRDESGFLLGRSFIQPRTFWLNSVIDFRGAIVSDLLINPAVRNASTLIAMTRAMKSPSGVDIVIHTSNEVSDQIYRKLFKFPVACTLAASGLPLNIKKILSLYLKNLKILLMLDVLFAPWRIGLVFLSKSMTAFSGIKFNSKPFDNEILEVLDEFKCIAGSHFDRNSSFLEWRFNKGPLFNGQVQWIGSRGSCIGYLVFKQVNLNGLNVCVLIDVVMRRKLSLIEGVAIKLLAVKYAVEASSDAVFTLANVDNAALKWLKGFPFIGISDSLLPHATPIFIHASEEIYPISDRKNIYMTLADLDYF
jgi:hypothetical protein